MYNVPCQISTEGTQRYSCTHTRPWRYNVVRGQRHAPAALPPGNKPVTYFTGGWVGFGAGPDVSGELLPHRCSNPRPSNR